MSYWLFWGVFRPILGYVPLFLKCYISFLTMFGTGVLSITKEVTTLKTFFAESPPLVWGIFGPIFVHVNLFLENHSVFFHKILHIIFWYFLWELINQKNMYGMSLFLWANFGYFGGLLCMFAYLLRSRQYFFYEILGRYFCELCQSQYGKILWHVTLFSETFFVFLGQSWEWFSISCRNLNIFSCYFVQKVFSLLWPSLIKKKYHAGSLFA